MTHAIVRVSCCDLCQFGWRSSNEYDHHRSQRCVLKLSCYQVHKNILIAIGFVVTVLICSSLQVVPSLLETGRFGSCVRVLYSFWCCRDHQDRDTFNMPTRASRSLLRDRKSHKAEHASISPHHISSTTLFSTRF